MSPAFPELSDLRSHSEAVRNRAWQQAYRLLWEAGMNIAQLRLAGGQHAENREDVVSKAIHEFIRGFGEKKHNSLNHSPTPDDCLRMVRHIVRQRIKDFLRSEGRSPVDYIGEIPEPPVDFKPEKRFRLDELVREIDQLEPDPPVPQVFRERFFSGMSTTEIANQRNMNINTLLGYFARGLRTLRERLTLLEGEHHD